MSLIDIKSTSTGFAHDRVAKVPEVVAANVTSSLAKPLHTKDEIVVVVDDVQWMELKAAKVSMLAMNAPENVRMPLLAAPLTAMLL